MKIIVLWLISTRTERKTRTVLRYIIFKLKFSSQNVILQKKTYTAAPKVAPQYMYIY